MITGSRVRFAAALLATACAFASSSAPATTLFFDDFNSGASSAWGNQRGNWRVTGGVYDATNPSNNPVTYSDVTTFPALTDFIVDVDVNAVDDGGIWLRSNFNGGSINGVLLVTGGGGGNNNGLYWHTVVNGGFSPILNNVIQPGLQGTNHHLRIMVTGNTYSAYLDGAGSPFTTLTIALFTSGAAGLYDFSPTSGASSPLGQTFDNFRISAVPGPAIGAGLPGLVLAFSGVLVWWRRRQTAAV
jgi:hypothetical protein